MANLRDLISRDIKNTALPYDRSLSVTEEALAWVDGQNLLTSIAGFTERRPGFNTVFANVGVGQSIRRLFLWRKWNGAFFLMAETGPTDPKLYKMQIGTDGDLVQLDSGTGSNFQDVDFVTANNAVYISGWVNKRYLGSGTTTVDWGLNTPLATPTTAQAAGAVTAVVGYKYVACHLESSSSHLSSPTAISTTTGPFTGKQVTVSLSVGTPPAHANQVGFYRTTDGGDGVFFELPNSPVALASPTTSILDTAVDESLKSNVAPRPGFNDPPGNTVGVGPWAVSYASRFWRSGTLATLGNRVGFTGFEEIDDGVEEESWPTQNFFNFPAEVTGLASTGVEDGLLLVFTPLRIHKIIGDSIDTFVQRTLFDGLGCRNRKAVCNVGKAVAWLDTSSTVHITDGFTEMDISKPIWADIAAIDHSKASLCYHNDNKRNWLLLANGVDKIWAYDFMTRRWMPPWTVGAVTAMVSGEKASGTKTLLIAKGTKVLEMTPSTYQDDGVTYSAFGVLGPYSLAPSLAVSNLEFVRIERNNVALTTVKQLPDEDPASGTFTELTNKVAAPLRVQGTALLDEWYYSRTPAVRRMAIRFDWAAATTNFKLYTIGFVGRECQRI